jgi:transcriptional regulator with XRE-family HTH domain
MSVVRDIKTPRVLGARIAAARRDRGLSQKDLSLALGIPVYSVDRIEAGATDAQRYLSSIAAVTGREIEWFTPTPPPTTAARTPRTDVSRDVPGVASAGRLLVLGAIVLLTTIRFFTEVVPVLPRAANFVDIPIFLTLVLAALLASPVPTGPRRWYLHLALPCLAFVALCALSVLANSGRVAAAPALVFVYGFLAPVGVYVASYCLWPPGNALSLSRTLVGLGIVQLVVVALVDVPQFIGSRNPDDIGGTFGTNPYQLVFFLLVLVALLIGIATLEPGRAVARFAPVLIVASFVAILLAQYRTLLVGVVVAMLATGALLGRRVRGFIVIAVAVAGFVGAFSYVAANLPTLKLNAAKTSLSSNPRQYVNGRLGVFKEVARLYGDIPMAVAVGTGPGTYSSRAFSTFAASESLSASNVQGGYALALTGGSAYATDVSNKYVLPQDKKGQIVEGSHAVTSPYASYTSLLAEVGVVGLALIVLVYIRAFARAWRMARESLATPTPTDSVPALVVATAVAFLTLLQLGALSGNWFEVTRISFIVWAVFAVVTKELDARDAR